jgi:hypothetical protein
MFREFIAHDLRLRFCSLNRAFANPRNLALVLPVSPPNRTCARYGNIGAFDIWRAGAARNGRLSCRLFNGKLCCHCGNPISFREMMSMSQIHKKALLSIFIVAAFLTRPAAADEVPKITRDFLTHCKTKIESCYDEIAVVIVANAVSAATGGKTKFCVPKSVTSSEAAYVASHRRVIKWITDHSESYGQPTNESIRVALVAMYPCRK